MYHTILVPLDGSTRAEAVMPHVEDLARQGDATIVLLEVIEPFYDTMAPDGSGPIVDIRAVIDEEMTDARAYLGGLAADLGKRGIKAQARVILTHGIVGTIIDVANEVGADLIAMASHGRTGLARVFYGSVALGVLHSVDRPLLLVRSRESE